MEVKVKAKFIKMSPRKIRLVVNVIRGMEINKALNQLQFIRKWAAKPEMKLVNSAIADAENNFKLSKDNLYIKEVRVDEGPTIHRWMPKAHGRATPIRKRSSHIILTLSEIKETARPKIKKEKIEPPVKLKESVKEKEAVRIERKEEAPSQADAKEKGKEIIDPRREGRGGHTRMEGGGHKGFTSKIFRRKSG